MKISMINYTNKLEEYIKNNKTYVLAFIAIFGGMFCGPTMQMAGRVFRKHPSVQFKQVVQSEESEHPMVKTALPSQSFAWDESLRIWKTMKVNEKIDEITEMMLIEVVQNMVPMPEYITNKKKKKKSSFKA